MGSIIKILVLNAMALAANIGNRKINNFQFYLHPPLICRITTIFYGSLLICPKNKKIICPIHNAKGNANQVGHSHLGHKETRP
jgi:hypothetical protein